MPRRLLGVGSRNEGTARERATGSGTGDYNETEYNLLMGLPQVEVPLIRVLVPLIGMRAIKKEVKCDWISNDFY